MRKDAHRYAASFSSTADNNNQPFIFYCNDRRKLPPEEAGNQPAVAEALRGTKRQEISYEIHPHCR